MNFLEKADLQPRTKRRYLQMLGVFRRKCQTDDIATINAYISVHRTALPPLRTYLVALNRFDDLPKLAKLKWKHRQKEGVYLPKEMQIAIINGLENPKWKMVALLQYLTGCRVSDVLGIKKSNVIPETQYEKIGLRIKLIQKGGTERTVYILKEHAEMVYDFFQQSQFAYPFLERDVYDVIRSDGRKNNYEAEIKKVVTQIWKSPEAAGLTSEAVDAYNIVAFQTHDFRRGYIDFAYDKMKDIRIVKDLAGHKSIRWTLQYLRKSIDKETFIKAVQEMQR